MLPRQTLMLRIDILSIASTSAFFRSRLRDRGFCQGSGQEVFFWPATGAGGVSGSVANAAAGDSRPGRGRKSAEQDGGRAMAADQGGAFRGRHFTAEVILWAYRDLAAMLSDRGVLVDHTTLFRWVQAYAATLGKRVRRHLRPCTGSWRVDETYIKVRGVWTYLYRAVDSLGQTIDFLLSARRDAAAPKRFFRKALAQPHTVNPRTITVDKNPAYPRAAAELKRTGELWRFSRLRQCKYLNNIVKQDHRRIKRLVRPGLGFGSLLTARQTLAGYEAMAMIRKRQVQTISSHDMQAQTAFVASLFQLAA
jgi:transposase, IS6 family